MIEITNPDEGLVRFPPPDPKWSSWAEKPLIFSVDENSSGLRLDKFLTESSTFSRGMIRELIDFGGVWLDGRVCRKQSRILEAGQETIIQVPLYGPVRFYEARSSRIVYEDEWLLAYDKEAGPPCQQTPYDGYNHLYGALARLRPRDYLGLHHRLDSLTSGITVFSRKKEANPGLSRLFRDGPLEKTYLAVVRGEPEAAEWRVDLPIAKNKGAYVIPADGLGKTAQTIFKLAAAGRGKALVQARPLTGRTHQIRLHLAAAGFPILGDARHGGPPHRRMMLHAWTLSLIHPLTKKPLVLTAQPPDGFYREDFEID
ncbi:MAG: RluA family pseudouridine synthase [Pseudomonadota bacterium]